MIVYMSGSPNVLYYFSPINWCSITDVDKNGITARPDVSWIITVLCIFFAAEIVVLFAFGSKKIKFVLDTKGEIT